MCVCVCVCVCVYGWKRVTHVSLTTSVMILIFGVCVDRFKRHLTTK